MSLKRREFLKILGATTVATRLPGCTPKEPRSLLPYVIPHEEILPGRSVWYSSVCRECPAGCGVTVKVREGRATKVEGNALHPVNRGSLCARGQASLQGLYNPDRVQTPLQKTASGGWEPLSWGKAEEIIISRLHGIREEGRGKDVVWITPRMTGSLDALVDAWLSAAGSNRRYRYEPFAHEAMKKANEAAFDRPEVPTYNFDGVETLFSFGADFLETWISPVGFAREFAVGRGNSTEGKRIRFTYFGPRLSMTATNADRWIDIHPDVLGNLALALVSVILDEDLGTLSPGDAARVRSLVKGYSPEQVSGLTGLAPDRIKELARTFGAPHRSLAVAGGPVVEGEYGVQTLTAVNLLNFVCGNVGRSVVFGPSGSLSEDGGYASMESLAASMARDEISALFLTDVNPAFSMPPGSGFAAAVAKVPFVVACSTVMDETTALATLVLPIHTPLETWGDFEPREGVHGLMQPVMQPVFKTKMLGDILLETGRTIGTPREFPAANFHDYVKERWRGMYSRLRSGASFEAFWVEALARGGVWETIGPGPVSLSRRLVPARVAGPTGIPSRGGTTFTLLVYPSLAAFDGRGANKPWLQELPDPMTRLVWGSWIEIGPDDAARLNVVNGDGVRVTSAYGSNEMPVHVYRGLRSGCVAIPLGQGHTQFGRYATGVGSNAYTLLDPKPSPDGSGGIQWFGTKVEVVKLPGKMTIASVQESESQHDREIIQEIPVAALSPAVPAVRTEAPSLYPEQTYPKHRWGMVIDVDKCTGCSACVTACYAENNIPVVGKEEVLQGREMAWLRIDRYYEDRTGEEKEKREERAGFLPMLCQHCGSAPCETVCPVYATYHTEEGLNGQVYNRCIGTRYCANNCPYKVRRFNWFEHEIPEPLNWQLNPDVTVRSPGVMEKCTLCVQRIVEGKNNARIEGRELADGEIRTACQQACPSHAITFGDLKDPESAVSVLAAKDRQRPYHVLEELNTLPAVTYLKKITT